MFRQRWTGPLQSTENFRRLRTFCGSTDIPILTGPGPFLYHLYDDRGLDVLGGSRELLLPQ